MSQLYLFGAGVFVALALAAIVAGASVISDHGKRIAALELRANPASKHDLRYLERQDIGEATLFDLANLSEQIELYQLHLKQAIRRAQHVAGGGRPDDPAASWNK